MAIGVELRSNLESTLFKEREEREFVPISKAHRDFWRFVQDTFPNERQLQDKIMARYCGLIDWLVMPRSVEDFQSLKRDLYNLHEGAEDKYELQRHLGVKIMSEDPNDFSQPYLAPQFWESGPKLTTEGYEWKEAASWVRAISYQLKILPLEVIRSMPGYFSAESLWNSIDGDRIIPNNEVRVHSSLEALVSFMRGRQGRRGLLFGDFRVGDHTGHNQIFMAGKLAVGKRGDFIVVTPTRKTIQKTTTKGDAYDDKERLYRLGNNKHIDHLVMLDMPERFYANPTLYWLEVWKAISPDLVFLGEKSHPLQPIYEERSRQLGGLLIIDEKDSAIRSGQLIQHPID